MILILSPPPFLEASIMDDTRRLTVMTSQTCGCSSLKPGEIEFMMHRNLQNDDGRGLAEGNMDRTNANLQLRVMIGGDADTLRTTVTPNPNRTVAHC